MSHRTDWRVLRTHDPIPGNAPELKDASRDYERIRQALVTAQQELDKVITRDFTEEMISASVSEVKESAKTIREALRKIAGRYSVAATQLSQFADELASAQTTADEAEREAQQAQAVKEQAYENKRNAERRHDSALSAVNKYQRSLTSQEKALNQMAAYSGDPGSAPQEWQVDQARRDTRQTVNSLNNARQNLSSAQSDIWAADAEIRAADARINEARAKLIRAETKRNDAARNAAQRIRSQIENDGQNDTWWDNWGSKIVDFIVAIGKGLVDAVGKIGEALKDLANALATLAEALDALRRGDLEEFNQKLSEAFWTAMEGLSKLADAISTICGTLALVLAFLPIPGARIAAGVLGTISKVASLVHMGAEALLGVNELVTTGSADRLKKLATDVAVQALVKVATVGVAQVANGVKSAHMSNVSTRRVLNPSLPGQTKVTTAHTLGKTMKFTANNTMKAIKTNSLGSLNPSTYSSNQLRQMTNGFKDMGMPKSMAQGFTSMVTNPTIITATGKVIKAGGNEVKELVYSYIDNGPKHSEPSQAFLPRVVLPVKAGMTD